MIDLIKDSFFLSYIFNFFAFISQKFKEGYIYSLFSRIINKFNYWVSNSRFWSYFARKDSLDEKYKESGFVRIIDKLINIPTNLLRKVYDKFELQINHSLIFKFINFLSDKFNLVFGLILILTMMIPDHMWFNVYGVVFTLLLVLLYLFKTAVDNNFDFSIKDLDISFIFFMIAIVLSAVLSLFPKDSLNDLIYYVITFVSILILVNSTKDTEDLNVIVKLMVFGAFLTAVYGVYQWKVIGIEVNPSLTDITVNQGMGGRVFSTMGNPNIYGELLILTMPFFLVAILNSDKLWKKAMYFLMLGFTGIILLKTGSRSAWVSFAFAIGVFVFFKNKKLLPVLMLIGVLAIPFLPESIYRRILTIFNPNDSSLQYRKEILQPAIPMLADYWKTGVGLGNDVFNTIYKRYKTLTLKTVAHTHNLFLQIWLESGVVALVSLLWLGFRLIKKTNYIIKNHKNKKLHNIVIGAISAIAGLMIMGFADHVWFYNRILYMFWIVVGLILAANKIMNKSEKIK